MERLSFFLILSILASAYPFLEACPTNCHCLGHLQHVNCYSSGLTKLPKISEQTLLLNLQKNSFPVLAPNSFKEMKGLESLHLEHCQIRKVSNGAFRGLKKLAYLYLSHNDISVIGTGAFNELSKLTYLYMDHNKILEIPKGLLSPLFNLFSLQMNNNKVREVKSGTFAGAKVLRWLYLSENKITTMHPGSLDEVENLAIFHIQGNQLSTYPLAAVSKLRVVEDFKISRNPIKVIPDYAFQSFGRYMESLSLDHMGLEKFSEKAFDGVTTLKTLKIEGNKLTELPDNAPLSNLQSLTLASNPWNCNCQLAAVKRWMDSSRQSPNATCASPAQYRGQQIKTTRAFRDCTQPTMKSKKGDHQEVS